MLRLIVFLSTQFMFIEVMASENIKPQNRGIASTAHPLATQAAADIYRQGGNSVDAAITVSFVLSVVEPTMSGLGGRAQAILRTATGEFIGYNGMTEIPQGFVKTENMPNSGYSTIATPGLIALLWDMHEEYGELPFEELLKPAIKYAEKGFYILPGEAERHKSAVSEINKSKGMADAFLKSDGSSFVSGELLRQPVLAHTLKQIADDGADAFYEGEIAKLMSQDIIDNGGFVTLQDLVDYQVLPGRYISIPYRGFNIHTLAAPAGGGLIAKTLMLLNTFDVANMDERRWAALVSQALAISIESMSDNYYEKDLDVLLDQTWASKERKRISIPRSSSRVRSLDISFSKKFDTNWVGEPGAHTSHFVTADCSGLAVSLTQTIGPVFGAKAATPNLGFAYAATMGGYLRTGPQIPGERPRTAIAPVFVTKKNKIVLALGAAGGIRIPSAIVQTISRFIDQGKTLSEAIAAPRIHPKQRIDENNRRVIDLLAFEAETSAPGWSQADVNYWHTQGFNVTEVDKHASFGRVHAITKQNNVLKGTADPDWEGSASDQMICGGVAN